MTLIARREVLLGATATVLVSCGGGDDRTGPQPDRDPSTLSMRDCQDVVNTMFTEVFQKTHSVRQIAFRAGFPVTPELESNEINRGLEQIKRLFRIGFINFDVGNGREPSQDGYDYAWSIRFACNAEGVRNSITFKMSFDAL